MIILKSAVGLYIDRLSQLMDLCNGQYNGKIIKIINLNLISKIIKIRSGPIYMPNEDRLTQIMDLCNGDFRNKNRSATGLCGFPRTAPAAKSRPESAPLSTHTRHNIIIRRHYSIIIYKN